MFMFSTAFQASLDATSNGRLTMVFTIVLQKIEPAKETSTSSGAVNGGSKKGSTLRPVMQASATLSSLNERTPQ
jgi:hypothetical protein